MLGEYGDTWIWIALTICSNNFLGNAFSIAVDYSKDFLGCLIVPLNYKLPSLDYDSPDAVNENRRLANMSHDI